MNWDDILKEQEQDPGFAPVPESKYPVRVEAAEATKASTGADMIKVQFGIVGGPFDTKKVFTNIVFSVGNPTAMRFTLRKLAALGVTKEILAAQNPTTAQIAGMILGAEAEAEVTLRPATEEYPAKNDVKSLKRLGAAIPDAPAPAPAPSTGGPPVPTPPAPAVPPPPPVPTPPTPPVPEPPAPPAPEPAPAPEPQPEPAPEAAPPIPTPPSEPVAEPEAAAPAPDVPPAPGEVDDEDPF
jgi:hypothetical protein